MSAQASSSGRRFDIDALLDAALGVFFAEGFTGTQVVEIAHAAGTTKPTLYARIGNKERIYIMVVRREAELFQAQVENAYQRGGDLPLGQLAEVGMEPLFRFARERPEGFHLLFRGDAVGEEIASIRGVVVDGVIDRLTELIEYRQKSFGQQIGPSAGLLAAACVGVARQVCERAIERCDDLAEAQHLAAKFVENAIRNGGHAPFVQ